MISADLSRYKSALQLEIDALLGDRTVFDALLPDFAGVRRLLTGVIDQSHRHSDYLRYTEPQVYPLISHRLYSTIFNEIVLSPTTDRVRRAMTAVGDIVIPLSGVGGAERPIGARLDRIGSALGKCAAAEPLFNSVLLEARGETQPHHTKIDVFHTSSGLPLLLRKELRSPTSLVLQSMEVVGSPDDTPLESNGKTHIPAGCIVDVNNANAQLTGRLEGNEGVTIATWLLDDVLTISPLRYSAWAYTDPERRKWFAIQQTDSPLQRPEFEPTLAEMLEQTTIDDFRIAASLFMEKCGIAKPA